MTLVELIPLLVIVAIFGLALWLAPKGWRTTVFNAATFAWTGLLGILQLVLPAFGGADFSSFLTAKEAALATLLVTAGNYILRQITTTPPGKAL